MKLTIQQDPAVAETEVILRCPVLDARLESLISHIRQYSFVLVGYQEQREFHLPLESIYFLTWYFRRRQQLLAQELNQLLQEQHKDSGMES